MKVRYQGLWEKYRRMHDWLDGEVFSIEKQIEKLEPKG